MMGRALHTSTEFFPIATHLSLSIGKISGKFKFFYKVSGQHSLKLSRSRQTKDIWEIVRNPKRLRRWDN